MWDTATTKRTATHLPHDMPCTRCGHPSHTYLPCSDTCACVPTPPPGANPSDAGWAAAA